jgi:hypothetical protein
LPRLLDVDAIKRTIAAGVTKVLTYTCSFR